MLPVDPLPISSIKQKRSKKRAFKNEPVDEKTLRKREQNRKDVAKSLAKKKEACNNNQRTANRLEEESRLKMNSNNGMKARLSFAVDKVLIPFLHYNSPYIDPSVVYHFHQRLMVDENNIARDVHQEQHADVNFIQLREELERVNDELAEDEYNKNNKEVMAPKLNVCESTLGARHTKCKLKQNTVFYAYQAKIFEYEIKQHDRLSTCLMSYWNYFEPHLKHILSNPPIWWHAQQIGFMEQLNEFYYILFNPG